MKFSRNPEIRVKQTQWDCHISASQHPRFQKQPANRNSEEKIKELNSEDSNMKNIKQFSELPINAFVTSDNGEDNVRTAFKSDLMKMTKTLLFFMNNKLLGAGLN